jgi:hypothetical protein
MKVSPRGFIAAPTDGATTPRRTPAAIATRTRTVRFPASRRSAERRGGALAVGSVESVTEAR